MLTTTAFLFLMTISVYGVVYGKTKELLYRKNWLIYYPFDTKERKVSDNEIQSGQIRSL